MSSKVENNDLEFDPLEIEPISKKSMVIFFLVDSSGSMYGTKIGTLNTTMEEIIPELRGIGGATTDIKLAVLSFSDGCKWLTETPISIDEYQYWTRLKAEGLTDMGEAFQELSSKLSRKEFLKSPSLSYAPVIFLLSDGAATDDVRSGLKVLKNNKWYKYGMKISLGIGEHYDREILEEFTGNIELVFEAKKAVLSIFKVNKNINLEFTNNTHYDYNFIHPVNCFEIKSDNQTLGYISVVNPKVKDKINAKTNIVICELDIEKIVNAAEIKKVYKEPTKYQTVKFDFSIIVSSDVTYKDIENVIKSANLEYLISYELVDVYTNLEKLAGKKNITIRFNIGANDKTLSKEEIDLEREKLINKLQENDMTIPMA